MDISPEIPGNKNYIDNYSDGRFTICGEVYKGSLIVSPNKLISPWSIVNIEAIGKDDIDLILSKIPSLEFLLIGSGASMPHSVSKIETILFQYQGVNLDIMETGAACRTYNVLMAEGRLVGAALISD